MITYQKRNKEFYVGCKKTDIPAVKITTPEEAFEFIRNFYGEDIDVYESFWIVLLNRANITNGFVKISQGGISQTVADVKIIAKIVVDSLSSGVIIAHNHPSGNVKASESDVELSKKVGYTLKMSDSVLIDSLIITDKEFLSLNNEGLI